MTADVKYVLRGIFPPPNTFHAYEKEKCTHRTCSVLSSRSSCPYISPGPYLQASKSVCWPGISQCIQSWQVLCSVTSHLPVSTWSGLAVRQGRPKGPNRTRPIWTDMRNNAPCRQGSPRGQGQRAMSTLEDRYWILGVPMMKPKEVSGPHLRNPQVLRNIDKMGIMSCDRSPM